MPAPDTKPPAPRGSLLSERYQLLAFLLCFLFGLAMIANIELGGEASWFWYATLLHGGAKLYSQLHLPLQPFYALETDGWMRLAGQRCLPYEALAAIHVFILCLGILLVLRESTWPDWRKAAIFLAAFFTDIYFVAVRFDDFHVLNDIFVLFSIVVLLRLYHSGALRQELLWAAAAGVLGGMSFTHRSTDGATLLIASAICVPFLARRRRALATLFFFVAAAASLLGIVCLTGDSLGAWMANSITHAAAAKGGAGTVLHGPLLAVLDNLKQLVLNKRWLWWGLIVAVGALARRGKDSARRVMSVELLFVAVLLGALLLTPLRRGLWNGTFIISSNLIFQNLLYPLCFFVLWRFWRARTDPAEHTWDPREILVFIPAGTLVSAAASQATGSFNSTISMTLLFLLSTFWLPGTGRLRWLNDCWVTIALVVALTGMLDKYRTPYTWNAYVYQRMFTGREWYRHPVYGPMYLDADLLHFIEPVCRAIQTGDPKRELLSLPYSYPNYFCATPPWRGYVQTWFDTTTPETIQALMQQLDQAPPQWILYERQISVLRAHEEEYNGGKPIMHRKLDEMIMAKLAAGQWKLVERADYLKGDGWYLIETHP